MNHKYVLEFKRILKEVARTTKMPHERYKLLLEKVKEGINNEKQ